MANAYHSWRSKFGDHITLFLKMQKKLRLCTQRGKKRTAGTPKLNLANRTLLNKKIKKGTILNFFGDQGDTFWDVEFLGDHIEKSPKKNVDDEVCHAMLRRC